MYVVGKNPCPGCRLKGEDRSGDNFHWYGDERGGYCHKCGHTITSTGEYNKNNNGGRVVDLSKKITKEKSDEIKAYTTSGDTDFRGIRADISKTFGVRYEWDDDGDLYAQYCPCTYTNPSSNETSIAGYKVRILPKDFSSPEGMTGKDCDLFMQWKFKTHNHTLLICGGEVDSLSAFQMLSDAQKDKKYDPVAVVSSTIGESGSYKQVQSQYDWCSKFKKIVICMDNDEAGREAEKKLIEVLPEGKVFVMRMRYKDPNSYIWDQATEKVINKQQEFINDFWTAKPYIPDGVKSVEDAFNEVTEELLKPRIPLPPYMHRLAEMMGGGPLQGRIMNIIADTSAGKSSHVNRMVYHWIFNAPETPTIVSLEATAAQYIIEMLSIHLETNLLWKKSGQEIVDFLTTPEGQEARRELCFKEDGTPRFFIIDDRKGNIKSLEAQMELLYKKHGSKLFVIDVLTDLLRGSSEQHAEDHMVFQKNMIKNGVTIINTMHTRKPQPNAEGKPRKVTEYDALGTGSFVQSAAYNIVLNRDKMSDDSIDRNTTEVELPKCRGGKTGSAGNWFYDFNTASCYDLDDWLKTHGRKTNF